MNFLTIFQTGLVPQGIPFWSELLIGFGCLIAGYLLGSINSAVLLSNLFYGEDIRDFGSGNAGTTNMMRRYGTKAAVLTLVLDMLKAGVAVWIGILCLGQNVAFLAGAACVIGHCFPIFFRFKGGKGVAVAAATCLFANPIVFLIELLFFVIIVAFTKYISLGSVMCALFLPVLMKSYYQFIGSSAVPFTVLLPLLFIVVFIIVQHRQNIKRLWNGEESKFSFKKSEKTQKQRSIDAHNEAHEDEE